MRLCVFEDAAVNLLEPLTLTRPAFDLRCGAATLLERLKRSLPAMETGTIVRPVLADLCRLTHPELAINDEEWLSAGPIILVNARWLPPDEALADLQTPRVGLANGQVAYIVLPPSDRIADCGLRIADCQDNQAAIRNPRTASRSAIRNSQSAINGTIDNWLAQCLDALPHRAAGGTMINYAWDLVEHNPPALARDAAWFAKESKLQQVDVALLGSKDDLLVHADATVEPLVVVDTRKGPVLIDRGAQVQSFSRLEGPCYIGAETWIVGAKVRGGAFGPCCRIGGEVEASVIQGFSNKYHDGFLGHSYLGEWVNFGAGTQVSDLRNDYGQIKVIIGGERIGTGLSKAGVFVGDHCKTGLGTLLNSGSVIGAFSNLLPSGTFLPPVVPPFSVVRYGQILERSDLRQLFHTAAQVLRRRGQELTGTHIDCFFNLYDDTSAQRSRTIRDSERRRLRRSV